MKLAVVVPAYNEAAGIGATLAALRDQVDDDFDLYVVDNGSVDATADIVRSVACEWQRARWHVISEPQKGTGAAADTGIRAAIAAGATHVARTDADCLPVPGWTAAVRAAFSAGGIELVTGPMLPRVDEAPVGRMRRRLLLATVTVGAWYGRIRPSNRGSQYLGPYLMCPGCNLAISAELYLACGGFPRSAIEDLHEDRALVNAVRTLTAAYGFRRDVCVYASTRRVRAWGLRRTIAWYADHLYRPEVVDIR